MKQMSFKQHSTPLLGAKHGFGAVAATAKGGGDSYKRVKCLTGHRYRLEQWPVLLPSLIFRHLEVWIPSESTIPPLYNVLHTMHSCRIVLLIANVIAFSLLFVPMQESDDTAKPSVSQISSLSDWPDHLLKKLDEQQAEADSFNKVNKVSILTLLYLSPSWLLSSRGRRCCMCIFSTLCKSLLLCINRPWLKLGTWFFTGVGKAPWLHHLHFPVNPLSGKFIQLLWSLEARKDLLSATKIALE